MRRLPTLTALLVLMAATCLAFLAAPAPARPLAAPTPARAAWIWPVTGDVITPYRNGTDPYATGQHRGIDIAALVGTAVRAATAGDVRFAGTAGSSGLTIAIRTADGYDTSYLHLSSAAVHAGAHVSQGDRIGAVGMTGTRSATAPHLHFGVRDAGTRHAYHDPLSLLPPPPAANPKPDPPSPAPAPAPNPAPPVTAPVPVPVPVAEGAPAPRGAPGRGPAPRMHPAPRAQPSPRSAPGPGLAPRAQPSPRSAPRPGPAPRSDRGPLPSPRTAPRPVTAQPPGTALGHTPHSSPAADRAPDALVGFEGTSHAPPHAESRTSPARANAPSPHGQPTASWDLDPLPGARTAPAQNAAVVTHRPSQGAARADAEGNGPDSGWAAACAGLLLAAALLGLTDDGRRTTRHTRTRLLRALRPVLGRR
jgi:hypothetical protein